MPTECCVPLCHGKGGHLFPFAQSKEMVKKWVIAVKREQGKDWDGHKPGITKVCQAHFDSSDYVGKTAYGE